MPPNPRIPTLNLYLTLLGFLGSRETHLSAVAGVLGFLTPLGGILNVIAFGGMRQVPIFPDFLMDTSRHAVVLHQKASLPWRTLATPDEDGNVWVSAFQTNSVVVRGRCRYHREIVTVLAIVKDAHRVSDRDAMEKAEDSIRLQLAEYIDPGRLDPDRLDGRAIFYEKPKHRCRCNDLIG